MYSTLVTCLNKQFYICIHERYCHCYCGPIGKYEIGILPEFLDNAEDIIPSAAIQTCTMVPEFVDDLHSSSASPCNAVKSLTSSISNAATIVSIRTVPRIVPRGMPT
jgi:hypothetical protein